MTEVEKPLLTILIDKFMTAPDKRKPEAVADAQKALPKPFGVLNGALQGRDYLLGSNASPSPTSTSPRSAAGPSPSSSTSARFPNVGAWLDRCLARPAYKAARGSK